MKKSFFILCSLLLCSVLVSCSNEEQTAGIDQEKVEFVTQSTNNEVTRAAYQLLTPTEQYFIWNERIDYILEHEDLTTEQTAFVNELQADLNSNVFVHNSTDNISFKGKYNNSKLEIFHPIQGFYYFASFVSMVDNGKWSSISNGIGAEDFYDSVVLVPGDPNDGNHCTCNQGSMVNPGCETDCPSSEESRSGCGFLWLWSCNGYMPL